jgi:myosin heavy subunit
VEKFSRWEDRVNEKIDNALTEAVKNAGSPENLDNLRENLSMWDKESKKEVDELRSMMKEVKTSIDKVKKDVSNNEFKHSAFKMSELDAMVNGLKKSVRSIEDMFEKKVSKNNEMIKGAYKVMISLNDKNRIMEDKFQRLAKSVSTKIRFK